MFISYAQNSEDVLLWRALRQVERGFYVDVGANDPVDDSVTCAFYNRGWRGINVEPNATYAERLIAARPRDINLQLGCGLQRGQRDFFVVDNGRPTGLSTLIPAQAERHERDGFATTRNTIAIEPLSALLEAHAPVDIQFLKIDVEGAEREVLLGADLRRYRPWIILVEAIAPTTHVPNHQEWESILLDVDYRFVWFDGLNRYYVAAERHRELSLHFQVPLSSLDKYQKFKQGLAPGAIRAIVATAKTAAAEGGPQATSLAHLILQQASLFRTAGHLWAATELLEFGLSTYPDLADASRHPAFLKESLRTLLADQNYQKAKELLAGYPPEAHEKWSAVLFARAYETSGLYEEALNAWGAIKLNQKLPGFAREAAVCIARLERLSQRKPGRARAAD